MFLTRLRLYSPISFGLAVHGVLIALLEISLLAAAVWGPLAVLLGWRAGTAAFMTGGTLVVLGWTAARASRRWRRYANRPSALEQWTRLYPEDLGSVDRCLAIVCDAFEIDPEDRFRLEPSDPLDTLYDESFVIRLRLMSDYPGFIPGDGECVLVIDIGQFERLVRSVRKAFGVDCDRILHEGGTRLQWVADKALAATRGDRRRFL